jgi:hypothetical protein
MRETFGCQGISLVRQPEGHFLCLSAEHRSRHHWVFAYNRLGLPWCAGKVAFAMLVTSVGVRPGQAVLPQYGLDGVVVGQDEAVVHRLRQADLRPRGPASATSNHSRSANAACLTKPSSVVSDGTSRRLACSSVKPVQQTDDLNPVVGQERLDLLALTAGRRRCGTRRSFRDSKSPESQDRLRVHLDRTQAG